MSLKQLPRLLSAAQHWVAEKLGVLAHGPVPVTMALKSATHCAAGSWNDEPVPGVDPPPHCLTFDLLHNWAGQCKACHVRSGQTYVLAFAGHGSSGNQQPVAPCTKL